MNFSLFFYSGVNQEYSTYPGRTVQNRAAPPYSMIIDTPESGSTVSLTMRHCVIAESDFAVSIVPQRIGQQREEKVLFLWYRASGENRAPNPIMVALVCSAIYFVCVFSPSSYFTRVSEPACFGAAPAPGIFYPEPAPAPGKREHNVGIFLNWLRIV